MRFTPPTNRARWRSIDGRRVVRAGLADDGKLQGILGALGAAGTLFLTAGEHTLRLERAAPFRTLSHSPCAAIPARASPRHWKSCPERKSATISRFRWMIWSIPGIQSYTVRDGAYVIRTDALLQPPLFRPPGPIVPLRPPAVAPGRDRFAQARDPLAGRGQSLASPGRRGGKRLRCRANAGTWSGSRLVRSRSRHFVSPASCLSQRLLRIPVDMRPRAPSRVSPTLRRLRPG